MSDSEYRALIEHHAKQLLNLNQEPSLGYGLIKKEKIIERIARMRELAEGLE